jgi:beta-lactamase superfamily II metal-dependent hydrolase
VVARYVSRGTAVLRTDRDGAITFDAERSRIPAVARARGVSPRYWHDAPIEVAVPID